MTLGVSAQSEDPEILIEASFPESNPFGHVVNGERNQMYLVVENRSDKNVTLQLVAGSFHHPETGALIKNTSSLTYGLPLLEGSKLQLPYTFYSEFKPGDLRLNIWLEHSVDDENYRVTAYDSVVTVVEPEPSWFDFKLLSTYLIVIAGLVGLSYAAYTTYVPSLKPRRKRSTEVSAPVGTVTATGASGYQEEWIPEHHLKKNKGKKAKGDGVASSNDELSGGESGAERRTRKGKKY